MQLFQTGHCSSNTALEDCGWTGIICSPAFLTESQRSASHFLGIFSIKVDKSTWNSQKASETNSERRHWLDFAFWRKLCIVISRAQGRTETGSAETQKFFRKIYSANPLGSSSWQAVTVICYRVDSIQCQLVYSSMACCNLLCRTALNAVWWSVWNTRP